MDRREVADKFEMTGTIYDSFFIDFMDYYGGDGHDIVRWEPYEKLMICVYYDNGNKAYYDGGDGTVKNVGRRPEGVRFVDDEIIMRRFAWKLRSAINASPLSRAEICELTGISNGSLSGYISGRTAPNMVFIYKLANVLKCPVEELVNVADIDL